MKNINFLKLARYNDRSTYQLIEDNIYKDLRDTDDTSYRVVTTYELEEKEVYFYPPYLHRYIVACLI